MRDAQSKPKTGAGRQMSFWSHHADLIDEATVGISRSGWLDKIATAAAKKKLAARKSRKK